MKEELILAERALSIGDRLNGAIHLDKAYRIGVNAWNMSKNKG